MELQDLDIILKVYGGSIAYGTNTPKSDIDIRGVVIPRVDYFFGLKTFEQFEESPPADTIYYDIRKFFRLLLKCNPSAIEMIWAPQVDKKTNMFFLDALMINVWPKLISKQLIKSHIGMAQVHLRRIKHPGRNCGIKGKSAIEKFGYNTKDASHVIRVLQQCWEIIENKELTLPRPNADILLDIKNGEWDIERVREKAEFLMRNIRVVEEKSDLPELPHYGTLNNCCMDIVRRQLGG